MTDEPIDLDYLRSRHGVGQGTIHQLCDEIERLRTERDAASRLVYAYQHCGYVRDLARRASAAEVERDAALQRLAALTGEAS